MRILHVTEKLIGGGAETYLKMLCFNQVKLGHEVAIIFFKEPISAQDTINEMQEKGCKIIKWRFSSLPDILKEAMKAQIIHGNLIYAEFLGFILSVAFNKKLIVTRHSLDFFLHKTHWRIVNFLILKKTTAIICVSEAVKKFILSFRAASEKKCHVIYPAVDKDYMYSKLSGLNVRKLFNMENLKYALVPASLEEPKGIIYLLRAILALKNEARDWVFLFAGEGSLRKEFENFVIKNDIADKTKFIGFTRNIYDYIAQADMVVLPSLREGFGLVIHESLNFAKPIISTKTSGISESLGNSGILVEPRNSFELKEAITTMMNEEKRKYFCELSLKRAQNFSVGNMVDKTMDVYETALAQKAFKTCGC
ncbi:MAG: glycosyltransferase family 4 protein [Candidatus Omnitrophica bacterium]|nr:glycosyltransferase family 4 protein [Candidatus Omnitrophota bacterium]